MGVWPSVVDKGTFFTWKACHAVNKEGKIQNTNTQARESVAKNLQENARTSGVSKNIWARFLCALVVNAEPLIFSGDLDDRCAYTSRAVARIRRVWEFRNL